jgi:hypothetical protein
VVLYRPPARVGLARVGQHPVEIGKIAVDDVAECQIVVVAALDLIECGLTFAVIDIPADDAVLALIIAPPDLHGDVLIDRGGNVLHFEDHRRWLWVGRAPVGLHGAGHAVGRIVLAAIFVFGSGGPGKEIAERPVDAAATVSHGIASAAIGWDRPVTG